MEAFAHGIRAQFSRRDLLRTVAVSPAAFLSLIPAGCSQSQNSVPAPQGMPLVRVLVLENRPRVDLRATQPPILRIGAAAGQRVAIPAGSSVPVLQTGSGWKVGDLTYGSGELTIDPATEGSVSVDGRAHRGSYRLIPRPSGKIDVINDIDVDGYLMGVLSKELFPNWHDEAYCAQAVAARTYSLFVSRTTSETAGYDLFADTRSQVYGGIAGESAKSRAAVEATRGLVVAFGPDGQERIFKAYYSSCCGGITQSAAAAFGEPAFEPLTEQNNGPRCAASPKFSWPAIVLSKREITRRLRIWGTNMNAPEKTIGDVSRIDVLSTNSLGRPSSFAVTDIRGYRYRLGCEDLRVAINTDASEGTKLWSSFCKPVNEANAMHFVEGHGFGHGVGLCQWCAQVQAQAGVPYRQIVLQAFPRSVLIKAY